MKILTLRIWGKINHKIKHYLETKLHLLENQLNLSSQPKEQGISLKLQKKPLQV